MKTGHTGDKKKKCERGKDEKEEGKEKSEREEKKRRWNRRRNGKGRGRRRKKEEEEERRVWVWKIKLTTHARCCAACLEGVTIGAPTRETSSPCATISDRYQETNMAAWAVLTTIDNCKEKMNNEAQGWTFLFCPTWCYKFSFVRLYLFISFFLLSIHPPIYLFIHLFIHLFIYLFIHLSIQLTK